MKRKFLFTSDTCQLASIRSAAREFFRDCGIDECEAELLVLAIDEACTNIIRHAYLHECRPVRLLLSYHDAHLSVCLRDYGKSCDPSTIRSRPLHEFRPGGVGVHIMRHIFDEVVYTPMPRGTKLTMTKNMAASPAPARKN